MASIMQGGKRPMPGGMPMARTDEHGAAGGGDSTTIEHNPDGTHTVQHADGETSGPHDHIHGAMAAIAEKHEGMHHFTHNDGMGGPMMTHETAHGQPHEMHDHENLESVKHGMDKFFDEEGKETGGHDGENEGDGEDEEY